MMFRKFRIGCLLSIWFCLFAVNSSKGEPQNICFDLFKQKEKTFIEYKLPDESSSTSQLSDADFDDTLPPLARNVRRRYDRGYLYHNKKFPLSTFFLSITSSDAEGRPDINKAINLLQDTGHLRDYERSFDFNALLDYFLEKATASDRFGALSIINRRQNPNYSTRSYPFSNPQIRLNLYNKIWDPRMDPNLGISDSPDSNLVGQAIENNDSILFNFMISRTEANAKIKVDIIRNRLIEQFLFHEKYHIATQVLSMFKGRIPKRQIISTLIQVTLYTSSGRPNQVLTKILSTPIWEEVISEITSSDLHFNYGPGSLGIRVSGLSLPILQAATNLDHETVNAILGSRLKILQTYDDLYSARFIFNLVHLRSQYDEVLLNLEKHHRFLNLIRAKLKRNDLELDTDQMGRAGLILRIGENQKMSLDSEELDRLVGPISVAEVLENFYDGKLPNWKVIPQMISKPALQENSNFWFGFN